MVWIYGDGLIAGEDNDYYTSKLVTQGDVIVVTFNYRLGAFGFFAQPVIDAEHHLRQPLQAYEPAVRLAVGQEEPFPA
jgi:carboxylesterase type B